MPSPFRSLVLAVALTACGTAPTAPPPAAPAPTAPPAAGAPAIPAALPAGGQTFDEPYRALFETCDRTDRFGGIQLPITVNGRIRWYGCRSDPSRVAALLRYPDATIAFESKLAVDLDGSFYACSTPGLTDLCPTSLMLPDANGRRVPVDSDRIPYVVIPLAAPAGGDPTRPGVNLAREFRDRTGVALGDLGVVLYQGRVVPVIVADGGPFNKLGEGSMALHRALGRELCARRDAQGRCVEVVRPLSGIGAGVVTVIFPRSAPAGLTAETVAATVEREALERWRRFSGGVP